MKDTRRSSRGMTLDSLDLRVPALRSASMPGSSGVRLSTCQPGYLRLKGIAAQGWTKLNRLCVLRESNSSAKNGHSSEDRNGNPMEPQAESGTLLP